MLRPYTELQLSYRIPPFVNQKKGQNAIKNPPYNSKTSLVFDEPASEWSAPKTSSWLEKAMNEGSLTFFNKPYCFIGKSGTIPFMAMLGNQFPNAQFMITGVLEPGSNTLGPNEFLHISYAKKLIACVSYVLSKFSY